LAIGEHTAAGTGMPWVLAGHMQSTTPWSSEQRNAPVGEAKTALLTAIVVGALLADVDLPAAKVTSSRVVYEHR